MSLVASMQNVTPNFPNHDLQSNSTSGVNPGSSSGVATDRSTYFKHLFQGSEGAAERWLSEREKRQRERTEKLRESLKKKTSTSSLQVLSGEKASFIPSTSNQSSGANFRQTSISDMLERGRTDVFFQSEGQMMNSNGKLSTESENLDRSNRNGIVKPARSSKGEAPIQLPPIITSRNSSDQQGSENKALNSSNESARANKSSRKLSLGPANNSNELRKSTVNKRKLSEQVLINNAIQRRTIENGFELVPVGVPVSFANSTVPQPDTEVTTSVKKVYPDSVTGLSNKKYALNFCHLADAPLSFANHYLQERSKEQLDYRTICMFWLKHLANYSSDWMPLNQQSLYVRQPSGNQEAHEMWSDL